MGGDAGKAGSGDGANKAPFEPGTALRQVRRVVAPTGEDESLRRVRQLGKVRTEEVEHDGRGIVGEQGSPISEPGGEVHRDGCRARPGGREAASRYSAPFVLAALAVSSRDWLLATLEETSADGAPRRIGMRQVAGIREMFALFQEMDVMRGGGHARVALVEYMNSYVMPLVRRDHDPQVQRALYEAAAEQAYLVGRMAYDDGEHGLAQRYLIQALRLSQESGNAVLGAHILAGMSDQANLLGHPQEAVALARSGRWGITVGDSPACFADLLVLESRALAQLGEDAQATQAVAKFERVFSQVSHENEPEWARFIDRAYVFGEAACTFRDLGRTDESERFATESVTAARAQNRARRGALSQAVLAVGDLQRGEVEAAAARASQVVTMATTVNSTRCIEAVEDLQSRLKPFRHLDEVKSFEQRSRHLLGLAA